MGIPNFSAPSMDSTISRRAGHIAAADRAMPEHVAQTITDSPRLYNTLVGGAAMGQAYGIFQAVIGPVGTENVIPPVVDEIMERGHFV